MQLPPLMGKKSENKGSRSPTHTDDSSRPDSGQSSNSDYQTTSTTSQPASKNATVEQQASNTTVSFFVQMNILLMEYLLMNSCQTASRVNLAVTFSC